MNMYKNVKKQYISPEYDVDLFVIEASVMTLSGGGGESGPDLGEVPETPGGDIDF